MTREDDLIKDMEAEILRLRDAHAQLEATIAIASHTISLIAQKLGTVSGDLAAAIRPRR